MSLSVTYISNLDLQNPQYQWHPDRYIRVAGSDAVKMAVHPSDVPDNVPQQRFLLHLHVLALPLPTDSTCAQILTLIYTCLLLEKYINVYNRVFVAKLKCFIVIE